MMNGMLNGANAEEELQKDKTLEDFWEPSSITVTLQWIN